MTPRSTLFSREMLAGYDPTRLFEVRVLVVGTGALGQNVVLNLALSGVGDIWLVDMDHFEDHNRTRSPAYPTPPEQARYGMAKAAVVAQKLYPLMTAPKPVMRYATTCIEALGEGAFTGVSVVVSCVDTHRARAYLADKTRFLQLPLLEAGFEGNHLNLSCYPASNGEQAEADPCWRCSHEDLTGAFSCRFYAAAAEANGIIPALQTGAATLAGLQTEAAIQVLHGNLPLAHKVMHLDLHTGRSSVVCLTRDPGCQGIHRVLPTQPASLTTAAHLPVATLLEELEASGRGEAQIHLASPFVRTASCVRCGRFVQVDQPTWGWELSPYCLSCGGPFDLPTQDTEIFSPAVDQDLAQNLTPHLLTYPCRQVGLPPLALVEVWWPDGSLGYFQMPGAVEELFQTVPTPAG